MAGKQHERELARARAVRARQREEARQRKRTRVAIGVIGGVLGVSLIAGIALAVTGDDSPSAAGAPSPSPTSSSPFAVAQPVIGSCEPTSGETPENEQFKKFESTLTGDTARLDLQTNCGDLSIDMDVKGAPETANALAFLADRGFYDGTICHRLTTDGIYVLQCGDPEASGMGGPGFSLPDENLPKAGANGRAVYPRGTMAMANAGPGTTGSQFFLVYKDSPLPPDYTVVGTVTQGLDVLDAVAEAGTADGSGDGAPAQSVQIITAKTKAEQ